MKARTYIPFLLIPCLLSATQIQWYCTPGQLNLTSEGQTFDASFRFELGAFATGFQPTAENLDEWASNWVPVQRAVYDPTNGWFTGVYQVTGETPLSTGSKMYIWGFNGDPGEGEWILCRRSNWNLPSPNSRSPIPKTWNALNANVVVLGSVSNGLMTLSSTKVSNVPPPKTTWAQWAKEHLGNQNMDPAGDANGNGISDGLEFVMGIDGGEWTSGKGLKIRIVKNNGEGELELIVPRRSDRPARIDMEISWDLDEWFDASDVTEIKDNRPLEVIFRDNAGVLDMPGPWYWRYKVTPEE